MVQAEDLALAPLSVQQLAQLQADQCQRLRSYSWRARDSEHLNKESRHPHAKHCGWFVLAENDEMSFRRACRLQKSFNLYIIEQECLSPVLYLQHLQLQLVFPSTCRERSLVLRPDL